jgi:alpha-1,3-mannosyl-glycoprotein beta-1,2-N-acetylglucosaminyltransferase
MIESYGNNVTLIHQPDQSEFKLSGNSQQFLGYYKIARHYRWALNQTFFEFQYKSVIITEGDFILLYLLPENIFLFVQTIWTSPLIFLNILPRQDQYSRVTKHYYV